MNGQTQYDLSSVKLPRLAGMTLELFVRLVENPSTRGSINRLSAPKCRGYRLSQISHHGCAGIRPGIFDR